MDYARPTPPRAASLWISGLYGSFPPRVIQACRRRPPPRRAPGNRIPTSLCFGSQRASRARRPRLRRLDASGRRRRSLPPAAARARTAALREVGLAPAATPSEINPEAHWGGAWHGHSGQEKRRSSRPCNPSSTSHRGLLLETQCTDLELLVVVTTIPCLRDGPAPQPIGVRDKMQSPGSMLRITHRDEAPAS